MMESKNLNFNTGGIFFSFLKINYTLFLYTGFIIVKKGFLK